VGVGAAEVTGPGSAEAFKLGRGLADAPALAPGFDPGSGVDPASGSDGVKVAVWAPGAGSARGRIAAPMAIAATSAGRSAAATKRVDRVRFIGVSP
jgi:hypothetical protein